MKGMIFHSGLLVPITSTKGMKYTAERPLIHHTPDTRTHTLGIKTR